MNFEMSGHASSSVQVTVSAFLWRRLGTSSAKIGAAAVQQTQLGRFIKEGNSAQASRKPRIWGLRSTLGKNPLVYINCYLIGVSIVLFKRSDSYKTLKINHERRPSNFSSRFRTFLGDSDPFFNFLTFCSRDPTPQKLYKIKWYIRSVSFEILSFWCLQQFLNASLVRPFGPPSFRFR